MTKRHSPSRTRNAQVSTIDFITGLIIITIALILTANIISNIQQPSDFHHVKRQTIAASDTLMSEGYPDQWNTTTVVRLGLLTGNELNKTKLEQAQALPYDDLRAALNGVTNIYWYYANKTNIINLTACGYGDPSILTNAACEPTINEEGNIVRMDRFVTYNNTILRMVVLTWD